MTEEAPFTADEVKRLRELLEVDAIRKVTMLYSQLLDSGEIDALTEIFTEDAQCEFGPFGAWGGSRQVIKENYEKVFASEARMEFGFMHNTCNHWAELTGPDTAAGRSYLIDIYTHKDAGTSPIEWLGVYDIRYEKVGGRWLIKRLALNFLWPERQMTDDFSGPLPSR